MNKLILGETLKTLPHFGDASFDAIVTDPPYSSGGMFRGDRANGVADKYQVTGTVKKYSPFGGDNRDQRSYYFWAVLWMGELFRISKDQGWIFLFTDWRQLPLMTDILQAGGFVWRGVIPWNKTEAARPTRGRFRAQCEYILWGSKGFVNETSQECLPGFFTYVIKPGEKKHITGKPLGLMRDLIKITPPGGHVLDCFMGSGPTGVACTETGRNFTGIEQDPEYFRIASLEIAKAEGNRVFPGFENV